MNENPNTDTEAQLAQLRELFLASQESDATRLIAILASLALVAVVLWLVRRRSLQEEYTPIWMGVAFALLVVSFQMQILHGITRAIGAWTTSSTILYLGEFFLLVICLNYAVRLSRANLRLKNLAQEFALLRARVDELEGDPTRGGAP